MRIFEFDADYRLREMTAAQRAEYRGHGRWLLLEVIATQFTPEARAPCACPSANGARR